MLKVGSMYCPFCAYMGGFDSKVIESKGYALEHVSSDDIDKNPRLMQLLLQKVEGELELPTYVNFETRKVLHGGLTEKEFSRKIESILPQFSIEGSPYVPLTLRRLELSLWALFASKSQTVALPLDPSLPLPEEVELKVDTGDGRPVALLIHSLSSILDEQGKFSLCKKREND